jgi:hypothetical protein
MPADWVGVTLTAEETSVEPAGVMEGGDIGLAVTVALASAGSAGAGVGVFPLQEVERTVKKIRIVVSTKRKGFNFSFLVS